MDELQEQNKDLEDLGRFGKDISSCLSVEEIIKVSFESAKAMMAVDLLSIGLHKPEEEFLEFPATVLKSKWLPPYFVSLSETNSLATWCFNNQKEILINDFKSDLSDYLDQMLATEPWQSSESIVYLPMWHKEKVIGVFTAQSLMKNAFQEIELHKLSNMANYCALAIANTDAYWRNLALLDELKVAQDKLIIQSKLAGLGEITAGIAHEIQNPLNFVNNFSELSNELLEEMKEELLKGEYNKAVAIFDDIKQNLEKINAQGKRADSIVKGMLQHSRGVPGQKEPSDINALADEYLRLAYHGLRAKDKTFNATMRTNFDNTLRQIEVVPQDIGRVILNLINNAFYAVNEKRKLNIQGYTPVVSVSTRRLEGKVEIKVEDNGKGIPQEVKNKIFQPFFTTKPSGQGTGLGLSLSYEIVTKGHGGELKVETREGEGSAFLVLLPT